MNAAHLHLIINHIPIIGIPVVCIFLLYGLRTHNQALQRISLAMLALVAAFALPVYLTGEPAEEVVEELSGVGEHFIESHEEAAEHSLILTLIAGLAAAATLWLQRNHPREWLGFGTLALALLALLSLLYTANLGGKIRHTELRSHAYPEFAPSDNSRSKFLFSDTLGFVKTNSV